MLCNLNGVGSVKGKENDKLRGRKIGEWKLYFYRDVTALWLICMNCWFCKMEIEHYYCPWQGVLCMIGVWLKLVKIVKWHCLYWKNKLYCNYTFV